MKLKLKSSGALYSDRHSRPGALFRRPEPRRAAAEDERAPGLAAVAPGAHRLAFAGVWLFTLLLYLRPNDHFSFLGTFPLLKLVTIGAVLTYFISKKQAGEKTIWTTEARLIAVIAALGVVFMPIAASPQDSLNALLDPFIKVLVIFVMLNNLLDTRERLEAIIKLVIIFDVFYALAAVRSYLRGEFTLNGTRIHGISDGMFGNPNDLATNLVMLLPLAVALALTRKGMPRLFYWACVPAMAAGIVVTFSRAGFMALLAVGGILIWKFGRGQRLTTITAATLGLIAVLLLAPGKYGDRLSSIFNIQQDQTRSAQGRLELMKRAADLALKRSIIGIGMGNMPIYSLDNQVAHNSYLEILVELSILALIAYLIVIIAPLRALKRIELQTAHAPPGAERDKYYLSVGLQAAFVAYIICSFFASIQYQWYLYYIAAYAVALRRIHAAEPPANAEAQTPHCAALARQSAEKRGALWHSARATSGRSGSAGD